MNEMNEMWTWVISVAIVLGAVVMLNHFFPMPEHKGPCHEDTIAHIERSIKSHEMCLEIENCKITEDKINAHLRNQENIEACLNNDEK